MSTIDFGSSARLSTVLEQRVPGQEGADRASGGAAQGHDFVPFVSEQPLQRSSRKGRVATAALAGDRDWLLPDAFHEEILSVADVSREGYHRAHPP
jgi:hypothetical protein